MKGRFRHICGVWINISPWAGLGLLQRGHQTTYTEAHIERAQTTLKEEKSHLNEGGDDVVAVVEETHMRFCAGGAKKMLIKGGVFAFYLFDSLETALSQ